MNRCPITYEPCGNEKYSKKGLSRLSQTLRNLADLPYSASEQRQEAVARAGKLSIQGVQPKLSARLNVSQGKFDVVDTGGTFIIKPQHEFYIALPENEDLTMKMAAIVKIDVPLTGLVYSQDGSLSYFIKRFDRHGRNKKYHVEDFAQLTHGSRDTKYSSSMERLVPVLDYCTFPAIARLELFRRVLFCFITGNEDMHLKNFSLITRENIITLSPAYDLMNTSISLPKYYEELALPIAGKKRNVKKEDIIDYYGRKRLGIQVKAIDIELNRFTENKKQLEALIQISFLSEEMKGKYLDLLGERYTRMGL
jgi:serine/threonine-protein kinase HipA